MKKKVICAMSGGVDSSVAAALLLEQGYEVVGITCQIWINDFFDYSLKRSCCENNAINDAKKIAKQLGIKHYVLNYKNLFNEKVIKPFCDSYFLGETPNPCINCNRYIRLENLLLKTLGMGFDYLATGHYSRIYYDNDIKKYFLKTGIDKKKDQSYFLYQMNQFQLSHFLFPLGEYKKIDIIKIAKKYNFCTAEKKESQDICFVPKGKYVEFIEKYLKKKKTETSIYHINGSYIGKGKPIYNYTVGQRKKIGISNKNPLYVISIDNKNNSLIVGEKEKLIVNEIICNDIFFSYPNILKNKEIILVKVRYKSSLRKGVLFITQKGFKIKFLEKISSVAIGQSAVIHKLNNEIICGGGKIINYSNK